MLSKKIYYFIFSLTFLSTNSFAQEADFNQRICSIKDKQEREKAFIKAYRIESLYNKVNTMLKYSKYVPVHNYTAISAELNKSYEDFKTIQDSLGILRTVMAKLSDEEGNKAYALLQQYAQDHFLGVEEINISVAEILDAKIKYQIRDAQVAELEEVLLKEYKDDVFLEISSSKTISSLEKLFLEQWLFTLLPHAPGYQWTDSAASLHEYAWGIFYDSKVFSQPGGRHINSTFLLETVVNDTNPGLHLNLSFTDKVEEIETELNISLAFSPFSKTVPIKICDFNFPDERGNCVLMSFNNWCELHSSPPNMN